MLKKSIIIGVMCISFTGFSQTQCKGKTKNNTQCKNIIKKDNSLCHLHDPNHVVKSKNVHKTVICSGITSKNTPCKSRTKHKSGKCHHHRD